MAEPIDPLSGPISATPVHATPVHATWTYTDGDLYTAWKIVATRTAKDLSASQYRFWTICFVVVFSAGAGFAAIAMGVVMPSGGATVAALCAASYYLPRLVEGRLYERALQRYAARSLEDIARRPYTVMFDTDGFVFSGSEEQVTYRWPRIREFSESRGMLLFWLGTRSVFSVPRRALSEPDLLRLRTIVKGAAIGTKEPVAK